MLGCCGVGTWLWIRPPSLAGDWKGEEVIVWSPHEPKQVAVRRKAKQIQLILRVEDNGEQMGFYLADDGESLPVKWKVDRKYLELEGAGPGVLWTGRQSGRFAYKYVDHGYSWQELTLDPPAGQSPAVKLTKSKPRPWPT